MINYSIIVPHKDSVKYLLRLLDSIPNNDDIQVIIIDDNSDVAVVKQLQDIELNINIEIVFCDVSKGAGGARNIGIQKAKGKWVIFADSDDYFTIHLENLLIENVDSGADIIYINTGINNSHLFCLHISNYKIFSIFIIYIKYSFFISK